MTTVSHILLRQLIPNRHRRVVLPVHEFDRARFSKSRLWLRPFEGGRFRHAGNVVDHDPLEFSLWQLLHAAHRASLLRFPSTLEFQSGVATLFLRHHSLFSTAPELRLSDGTNSLYDETTLGDFAKQFAEGVAFLFMGARGYAFGERLEALLKRSAPGCGYRTPWGARRANASSRPSEKTPDFIFETADGSATALAESKGGFLSADEVAPIPGRLREGMAQLTGWSAVISPTPQKEFTIGTFLREESDGHDEPSMVTFVDPENEPGEGPRSYPQDAIRRGNYAAWLRGMGFVATANDLIRRRQRENAEVYLLPVVTINGAHLVLLPATGEVGDLSWTMFAGFSPEEALGWLLQGNGGFVPVIGLEARALETISRTIQLPPQRQFLEPVSFDSVEFHDGPVSGSLQRDGSFLGAVGGEGSRIESLTFHKFIL